MSVNRIITRVLPSLYFSPVAQVLVTDCGHRHVRPVGYHQQGGMLLCPFCEDQVGSHGNQPLSEASGSAQSEAQKTPSQHVETYPDGTVRQRWELDESKG